ncbi:MAG: CinA domain protein [Naasia sp.]|uniref:CinA family protein n=1 Tax=Naasia sp. TaxID=2546198 RepID=UPI00260D2435|nr:CinA family protein [Naasia sp.]MCU1571284.1 CinA domain protein [Naasia sp.]
MTAQRLLALLGERALTLAAAESLTGGLVADRLVSVPGASAVFRGGIVSYATELKHVLLGVDAALLERSGAVHADVAGQMAEGVRRSCGADVGISTTGVAGPDPQDGHAPGEVYLAVATAEGTRVRRVDLAGSRAEIRAAAVDAVLELAEEVVRSDSGAAGRPDAGRGLESE